MDKALHIWVQLHAFSTQRAIENFLLALSNAFVIAATTNSASMLDHSDSTTPLEQPRSLINVWLESASASTGWTPVLSGSGLLVLEENIPFFRHALEVLFVQLRSAWSLATLTTDWAYVAHAIFSNSSSGGFVHSLVMSESLEILTHMTNFSDENFTISTPCIFSSFLVKSFSDRLISFKSREEIQCWLLPHLSSTVAEVRFVLTLVMPNGADGAMECVARARSISPTLLPIDLGLCQDAKPSSSADWSASEWDDEMVQIVSAVSASGICQSVIFGHQPLIVEAASASSAGCFSALSRSLLRRGWALLARRARGGGRVVLLPAGEGRLVMQHVLTKELVLSVDGGSTACDAPLEMEQALESVKYADYYNPLQEDGQLVELLTQWVHGKNKGSFQQSHLEMNNQEKRKDEDQGPGPVKRHPLPIRIIKHQ